MIEINIHFDRVIQYLKAEIHFKITPYIYQKVLYPLNVPLFIAPSILRSILIDMNNANDY